MLRWVLKPLVRRLGCGRHDGQVCPQNLFSLVAPIAFLWAISIALYRACRESRFELAVLCLKPTIDFRNERRPHGLAVSTRVVRLDAVKLICGTGTSLDDVYVTWPRNVSRKSRTHTQLSHEPRQLDLPSRQYPHRSSTPFRIVERVILLRGRLSASPATGLTGLQENVYLVDFFGCLGFLSLATKRWVLLSRDKAGGGCITAPFSA